MAASKRPQWTWLALNAHIWNIKKSDEFKKEKEKQQKKKELEKPAFGKWDAKIFGTLLTSASSPNWIGGEELWTTKKTWVKKKEKNKSKELSRRPNIMHKSSLFLTEKGRPENVHRRTQIFYPVRRGS